MSVTLVACAGVHQGFRRCIAKFKVLKYFFEFHNPCFNPFLSVQESIRTPAYAAPCSLQQQVDIASLKEIDALPYLPSPKGVWSPIVKPFSLQPAYLVEGSVNSTAHAVLSLENTQGIQHSVQVVSNCYNESR